MKRPPATPPPICVMSKLPLSIAIVCKSNASTIGRTLDSVRDLASEIVAIDSGSTDETIPMLEAAGARVVRSAWLGHVKTKQMALEHCTQPWILALDSDESLEPDLAHAIREALTRNDPTVGGYELNRKVWYAGRLLHHTFQPEWRLRLVRQGHARWGGMDPHDKLSLIPAPPPPPHTPPPHTPPQQTPPDTQQAATNPLKVQRLAGDLRHDSWATIDEHLARQVNYARISARSLLAHNRRTGGTRLIISTFGALLKQIVLRSAWRDGWRGWAAAGSAAAGTLMKHIILLEQQQGQQQAPKQSSERTQQQTDVGPNH